MPRAILIAQSPANGKASLKHMDIFKPVPAAPPAIAHNGNGNGNGNGIDAGRAPPRANDGDRNAESASSDGDITARVKAALAALPDLIAMRVGVDTRDGVVTLTRSVESRMQTEAALATAAQVAGVKYVNDHLVVTARPMHRKPGPRTFRIGRLRRNDDIHHE